MRISLSSNVDPCPFLSGRNSSYKSTPSTPEIFWRVSTVGLNLPRSIPPIASSLNLACSANLAWVSPAFFLNERTLSPTITLIRANGQLLKWHSMAYPEAACQVINCSFPAISCSKLLLEA